MRSSLKKDTKKRRGKPKNVLQKRSNTLPLTRPLSGYTSTFVGVPDTLTTNFRYAQIVQMASSNPAVRFKANSPYDVNPVLGSTSCIGFAEWMAFYTRFRVIAYTYKVVIVNADVVPIIAYICNLNFDPTTSIANYYNFARNPYGEHTTIGVGGEARAVFQKTVKVSDIYGSNIEYSDQFYGTDSSDPTNLIWLGVGVQSGIITGIGSGVSMDITLTMHTRLFERKVLIQ